MALKNFGDLFCENGRLENRPAEVTTDSSIRRSQTRSTEDRQRNSSSHVPNNEILPEHLPSFVPLGFGCIVVFGWFGWFGKPGPWHGCYLLRRPA